MANEWLAQVVFPSVTGLSRDKAVNDWAVGWAGPPDPVDLLAASGLFATFYNTTHGGAAQPISLYLSESIDRSVGACMVNWYDVSGHLDGSAHGSPSRTDTWTLGDPVPSNSMLPREVAVVLSLQASGYTSVPEDGPTAAIPTPRRAQNYGAPATHMGTTRLRARLRGRVYIGPLNKSAAVGAGSQADARVEPDLILDLVGGLQDLQSGLAALTPAASLCVWSRRNASFVGLDGVTGHRIGWVDNAFDVVRRRGTLSSARTFATAP